MIKHFGDACQREIVGKSATLNALVDGEIVSYELCLDCWREIISTLERRTPEWQAQSN